MDLFTHVIFAYLLSFVLWGPAAPQYIAAGALAGGLPDADVLLFPLASRFPALEHRGIVHTILGVTVIAAVGSVLLPYLPYFPHASTLLYFVAMEIGGLSHLVLDGFTNFAVAPLVPFSRKRLRLDADVAVSFATLALTVATLVVLVAERGTVPFGVWVETAWLLVGVYGAYLVLRGVARWRAGVHAAREGFTKVAPSTNPWVWVLADERSTEHEYSIRYRRLRLGERTPGPSYSQTVAKVAARAGPVGSEQEALERTYVAALGESWWLADRYHYGRATARGNVFEVVWYVVEPMSFGRTPGVEGTIDRATGELRLKSRWVRADPST